MIKLFKVEWLKVKSYVTFYVLFGIFVLMYPLSFYFTAYKIMEAPAARNMEEQVMKSMMGSPFVFPKVWLSASWFGGLFFIIVGMLFILLITNEVQYRTHRQNIIDGWSRMDFLKAKLSMMLFFILSSTTLVFISGLIVGLVYSGSASDVFSGIYYVGYFALMAAIYLGAAFLIAMLVKRTGLAIIIYFALVCIVDNLVWLLLTLGDKQTGYFLPLETTDSLVPNPFKPSIMEKRTVEDYFLIGAALGYLGLFTYIIVNFFKKSDLRT